MASAVLPSQIELDDTGTAWVLGTTTKVIEVAMDRYAYGWSAEEIHFQHPHLGLGQVHAALAYYYDHQAELDAEIEAGRSGLAARRAVEASSPFVARMKAEGRLA